MLIAEQLKHNELIANCFRDFRKNFDKFYKSEIDDESANNIYT